MQCVVLNLYLIFVVLDMTELLDVVRPMISELLTKGLES